MPNEKFQYCQMYCNLCILFKLMPVYLACHRQVLQYYECISNMYVRAYLVVIVNDSRGSYKRFTRTSCGIGILTMANSTVLHCLPYRET